MLDDSWLRLIKRFNFVSSCFKFVVQVARMQMVAVRKARRRLEMGAICRVRSAERGMRDTGWNLANGNYFFPPATIINCHWIWDQVG